MNEFSDFERMEHGGWSETSRAANYVEFFSSASDQAISPLISAVDARDSLEALDLCCGQGNVADALVQRGCRVVGVDFSAAMLAHARSRVPSAEFIQADAQDLPFGDALFDVVVSNLGVCHVPDQLRVLSEIKRVLRPGGRFAMTVWCGPDISPCFRAIYEAIRAHGTPGVSLPAGPDFHQFARHETAQALLSRAGFSDVEQSIVDCAWDLNEPDRLFEIFAQGTVRVADLLKRQRSDDLAAIRNSLAKTVCENFAVGNHRWRVPVPAALTRARA